MIQTIRSIILAWMENMSCKIYSSLQYNYADVKSYVKYNEHYYFLVTNCTGSWGQIINCFIRQHSFMKCTPITQELPASVSK